ncbi:MAG: hypothetical protein LBP75_04415 [Planctomycetota bacterium]|jgi:hypothetical protein|nr:hypothetical protein [Planctomycetota bacterium]
MPKTAKHPEHKENIMYVSSSTASACMSMLNQQAQTKSSPTGDFAALLAENYRHTEILSVPARTIISEAHIPTDLGLYTPPDNYDTFRQNILNWNLNHKAKLSDEMFSTGNIGQKYLNDAGCASLSKARVENALPILPGSVEEARQRYAASYNHLDVYAYEVFESQGLEVYQTLTAANFVGFNGYYQAWGPVRTRMDRDENGKPLVDLEQLAELNGPKMAAIRQSDAWQEVTILTEETALYGAIANLAATNEKFRRAYDENPQQAARDYGQELGSAMESVEIPNVYNIRSEKRLNLQWFNGQA